MTMEILTFIQKFFVLLLPGTIGMLLYNKINIHKEQHYYFEFLKIILHSYFSFLFVDIIFGTIKHLFPHFVWSPVHILNYIGSSSILIPKENLIFAIISAIFISFIITKMNYENWLFRLANKIKLTRRIDNQPVWEHIFDDANVIVLRDYITKNTYYGQVISYSDNSDIREIYFNDVYVYNENAEFLYHAIGLYLSRAYNEFSIEIQDKTDTLNIKEVKEDGEK